MAHWFRCLVTVVVVSRLAGPCAPGLMGAETRIAQEVAILQVRILEGNGAVHQPGSRSSLPITVQVTDETGKPVENATVTFRLPSVGATGVFSSGLSTEVLTTDSGGRASVWKIRWGHSTGPAPVRITAVKGRARAGVMSNQYVDAGNAAGEHQRGSTPRSVSKPRGKWVAIGLVVAGAAAGGLVLGLSGKSSTSPAAAASTQGPSVQVGSPSISIGKP